MSAVTKPGTTDLKELRSFGLVFGSGLILIFGLFFPWLAERPWPLWPWITAAVFAMFALVYPPALRPLNSLWLKIGHVLGWINTRIILGLVFFVIFVPVSLLMKLLRKDPMARKHDAAIPSYRVQSRQPPREQLERPF
jgi:hypothetical protein